MKETTSGLRQGANQRHLPHVRQPAIVLQPHTYQALQAGVDVIANAIRPTLGPRPRMVVFERAKRNEAAEFLDDGATIARRIIEIEPRSHDVGAMLIRQALWRLRHEVGDGTATAAVIYQALLREGIRAVTQFDCNAALLRAGLEKGCRVVTEALRHQVMPLTGKAAIARAARGVCQSDDALAELFGEIFDIVGPDGMIVVEGWNKAGVEREYIEGTYWKLSGWFSRHFVTDSAAQRTIFEDAALLISDLELKEPAQVIPALERCIKAEVKQLVIVANDISDRVIGLLVNNNQAKTLQTLVVRAPKVLEMDRVASIGDIAILTGGKPFYHAAYTSFEEFRVDDLGHARRAWATDSLFGIYGGRNDPRQVRKHIAELRAQLRNAEEDHDRRDLQTRLGRLNGGTVILRVGGLHDVEREARKTMAERAITSLRHALSGGVVPGGGSALIAAQTALCGLPTQCSEEKFAYKMLARAIEEPTRAIAANAGAVPDVIIEKIKAAPCGYGFDARNGQLANMQEAGILDPAIVLQRALEIAVSGAAMALTTDVIVHHKKPVECVEP